MIVKAEGKSKQILKFPCKDGEKCGTLTNGNMTMAKGSIYGK